jgi:hypothetical protein
MQSIYAMHQNGSDNLRRRKVSFHSIDNIQDLYNDFFFLMEMQRN